MTSIPHEIHSSVMSLDMTKNSMKRLNSTQLKFLNNLIELKLRENEISTIPVGTFRNSNNLRSLDLGSNSLVVLEKEVFKDAGKLVHLDVSNNKLKKIEKAFDGLTSLSRLDLRNNRLTSITHLTFRELTQLRYLRLDDNIISHIDSRAFANLAKLMYFVIKGNPIGNLASIYFNSQFLSYVDLSECDLTRVPKGLPSSVRYVQLRRNKMAVLSRDAFSGCNDVTIIVLDENNMVEVEYGAFQHLHALQQLWMNGNQLEHVPGPLPASVKRLFLDSNRLQKIAEDDFPRESHMNTLSLMGNNISSVSPKAFRRVSDLRSLDLSGNQLTHIFSGTFAKNSQLQTLQLSKNQLEILESGCFRGLTGLRTLSMAYTSADAFVRPDCLKDMINLRKLDLDSSPGLLRSIVESEELMASLSSVQELSLENSELVSLRHDFPDFFPNLAVLRISSSTWHCDSNLIWFRNWLISAPFHIEHRNRNRCFTPSSLYDRSVSSLSDEDFAAAAPHTPHQTQRLLSGMPDVPSTSAPYLMVPGVDKVAHADWNAPLRSSSISLLKRTSESPIYGANSLSVRYKTLNGSREADYNSSSRDQFQIGIISWDELSNRLALPDYEGKILNHRRYEDLPHVLPNGRFAEDQNQNDSNAEISTLNAVVQLSKTTISSTANVISRDALINGITVAVVTVLATAVVAALLMAFIICLCRKRTSLPKQYPAENGLPVVNTGGANVNKEIMYFMTPASSKNGDLGKPQTVVIETENTRDVMNLIPGGGVNHYGQMRVYKWEDF